VRHRIFLCLCCSCRAKLSINVWQVENAGIALEKARNDFRNIKEEVVDQKAAAAEKVLVSLTIVALSY
jgi:hypothetical protein